MQALQQLLVALLLAVNAYAAEPPTVYQLVDQYGPAFGVATSSLNSTIWCESRVDIRAYNASDPFGGAKGVSQFLSPTFEHYAPLAGISKPDIWNPEHQIITMAYMFSKNEAKQWTAWRNLQKCGQCVCNEKAP